MIISPLRRLVRDSIAEYYHLNMGGDDNHPLIKKKADAVLNANPNWFPDGVPTVSGRTNLEYYANVIKVVNNLLSVESDGIEDFTP